MIVKRLTGVGLILSLTLACSSPEVEEQNVTQEEIVDEALNDDETEDDSDQVVESEPVKKKSVSSKSKDKEIKVSQEVTTSDAVKKPTKTRGGTDAETPAKEMKETQEVAPIEDVREAPTRTRNR